MKKRFDKFRICVFLLIVAILIVFNVEYNQFNHEVDNVKREDALKTLQAFYTQASSQLAEDYNESGSHDATDELDAILSDLADVKLNMYIPEVSVSVIVKQGDQRGRMLPVTGAFYVAEGGKDRGSVITDYLQNCRFDREFPAASFNALYKNSKTAYTKYYDPDLDAEYYLYYTPAEYENIELVIFCRTDMIDSYYDGLRSRANAFFYIELAIFTLLMTWTIIDRIYGRIYSSRQEDNVDSMRRRYKTVLVSKNNYIWEYFPTKDEMVWDEANSISEPLFDVSGQHRKEMLSSGAVHPDDQWTFYQFCDDLVTDEPSVKAEIRLLISNEYRWFEFRGIKVFGDDGFPVSVIGQTTDINEHKLENERLKMEASSDSLTKLFTYNAFRENVENIIKDNEDAEIMALLLIDVDDFTDINTNFGYAFADALLVDIAGRLKRIFPEGTILGRFGGDEFLAFIRQVPSMSSVIQTAQSVLSSIQNVMSESSQKYGLSCSIGIALYPVDDMAFASLFNKADMALYDAKQKGKGRYSIYNTGMAQIPESTRNKNIIKLKMPSSSSNDHQIVDSTILANAIDILFDSRDLNMSISVMISIIAIYYKLDHVEVVEYKETESRTTARILHEWTSEKSTRLKDNVRYTEYSLDDLFLGYAADSSGIFFCPDTSRLESGLDALKSDPFVHGAKSLIQFGIKYRSKYVYHINASCNEARDWSKEELDSLTLLSKLIGSYLVQLRSQETLDFVSQMDSLTGAYNFTAFLQRADKLLAAADGTQYAFIYADVQNFKMVNDTYGYAAGDSILLSIAEILQRAGGQTALLSRITGDRFVAVYDYENGTDLQNRIRWIIDESKQISAPDGDIYHFNLILGLYLVEPGDTAMISVDRANIALKNISDYHNCSFKFYDESMHENMLEQKVIEDSMEEAIEREDFLVYYQPKFNLTTKEMVGSEALVRWKRDNTLVPPEKFIPVFEDNGFILQLDHYMLNRVCATMRKCLDEGLRVNPVSVNFSRVHLSNTELPARIEATLKKYDIPPHLIEVEITESALNAKSTYQLRILNEIRALGCHLAMDDFGSGMSSLNILRELPFDILKLDKDFLHNNVMTSREQVIIKNVIKLAQDLQMRVICEGVETESQAQFLQSIGCDYAQGYLYSKPVPEQEFLDKYVRVE